MGALLKLKSSEIQPALDRKALLAMVIDPEYRRTVAKQFENKEADSQPDETFLHASKRKFDTDLF